MRHSLRRYKILALLLLLLASSCAHIPEGKTYSTGEVVRFEGFQFSISSAGYQNFYAQNGKKHYPDNRFLIVEVVEVNLYKKPVPSSFRPVINLMDEDGAEFNPSEAHTAALNRKSNGRSGDDLKPDVLYQRKLVFDVPEKEYRLSVVVPYFTGTDEQGGKVVKGKRFYYRLRPSGSQKQK